MDAANLREEVNDAVKSLASRDPGQLKAIQSGLAPDAVLEVPIYSAKGPEKIGDILALHAAFTTKTDVGKVKWDEDDKVATFSVKEVYALPLSHAPWPLSAASQLRFTVKWEDVSLGLSPDTNHPSPSHTAEPSKYHITKISKHSQPPRYRFLSAPHHIFIFLVRLVAPYVIGALVGVMRFFQRNPASNGVVRVSFAAVRETIQWMWSLIMGFLPFSTKQRIGTVINKLEAPTSPARAPDTASDTDAEEKEPEPTGLRAKDERTNRKPEESPIPVLKFNESAAEEPVEKAHVNNEPESKPKPKAESKLESKPETKSEPKAEPKPESKAEPKAEPKAESKAERKAASKPETKAESKPEPKTESKPESRPEPKAESKAKSKPEPKPEPKGEFKAERKSESKSESKPKSKPESKPESKTESQPESEDHPTFAEVAKIEPEPTTHEQPKSTEAAKSESETSEFPTLAEANPESEAATEHPTSSEATKFSEPSAEHPSFAEVAKLESDDSTEHPSFAEVAKIEPESTAHEHSTFAGAAKSKSESESESESEASEFPTLAEANPESEASTKHISSEAAKIPEPSAEHPSFAEAAKISEPEPSEPVAFPEAKHEPKATGAKKHKKKKHNGKRSN